MGEEAESFLLLLLVSSPDHLKAIFYAEHRHEYAALAGTRVVPVPVCSGLPEQV
jgi:hypothetical protein